MTRLQPHASSTKPPRIVDAPLPLTEELCSELRERLAKVRESESGGISQALRRRAELTIPQLSFAADIGERELLAFEESGNVRDLEEPVWDCVEGGFEAPGAAIDRLVRVLEPDADEEQQLRFDLIDEVDYLAGTLGKLLSLEPDQEASKSDADPWEYEPARARRRRGERGQGLSIVNALGVAPKAVETPNEEVASMPGQPTFKLQLVTETAEGSTASVAEIAIFSRHAQSIENVGMTLEESKDVLRQLQRTIVQQQVDAFVRSRSECSCCGRRLGKKGMHQIVYRTLFGKLELDSPRFRHCKCHTGGLRSFSPVAELLPERSSPELLFMEAKWASLVSFKMAARALQDMLPVDSKLSAASVRNHTLLVARRCESELGAEKFAFDEDHPAGDDKASVASPVTVGIDGGYLRKWKDRTSNFEVIVGKSVPTTGPAKCFGMVQQFDEKPKRRLFSVLAGQGVGAGQSVRFLSDGATIVRNLQRAMHPNAEHILDWFHIAMRLTVLKQYLRGIVRIEKDAGKYGVDSIGRKLQTALDSAKWNLWHGKTDDALDQLEDVNALSCNFEKSYPKYKKLECALRELCTYLRRNRSMMPSYGAYWREGRVISSALIESLVNSLLGKRFSKKQQMGWTPEGAHLLLQARVKFANGEMAVAFKNWYPDFSASDDYAEKEALAA